MQTIEWKTSKNTYTHKENSIWLIKHHCIAKCMKNLTPMVSYTRDIEPPAGNNVIVITLCETAALQT